MTVNTTEIPMFLFGDTDSSPSGVDAPKPENAVYMSRTPMPIPVIPLSEYCVVKTLAVFIDGCDARIYIPKALMIVISITAIIIVYLVDPRIPETDTKSPNKRVTSKSGNHEYEGRVIPKTYPIRGGTKTATLSAMRQRAIIW